MRRAHYLKANHHTRLPLRLIFVDTEALNEHGEIGAGRQRLAFGVGLYVRFFDSNSTEPAEEDKTWFRTPDEFWTWVESHCVKGRTLWVMAHNWNYDAGILNTSEELLTRGWDMRKYINGKPPLIVRWVKEGAYLHMVDTLNYFATSVASLGKAVDMPKLDMPKPDATQEDWDVYAWRDVEIIKAALLAFREFVRDNDLGVMQHTLASQALTAYRHGFMKAKILIHDHESALQLERDGYHGGRTETFWHGPYDGKLYKLDINSMYPTVMRNQVLSARFKSYYPSYQPSMWALELEENGVIARCKIKTEEPVYGLVHDHRLIFPVGEFETVLTDPEIRHALENDHIVSIGDWGVYEQENLFKDYVDYFYNLRSKYKEVGNVTFDLMTKLMLNALYGKFGQSGRKWVESDDYSILVGTETVFQETPDSPLVRLRHRLGKTQQLDQSGESENSAPIIAAEITAHARIMLWNLIKQAGKENVYYTDTDSLVVNQIGLDSLGNRIDSTKLGYLKIEETVTGAEFWAAKDYLFGDKRTIKGVRKNAVEIAGDLYEQEQFRSWDYNLKRGLDGFIDVEKLTKHLARVNRKGVVNGTGRVEPFRFSTAQQWRSLTTG